MIKIKYPVSKGTICNKMVLTEDYFINGVTVPAGFSSDGMTLKHRLLRIVISKYEPKFQPFFFLHDYLCDREEYKKADDLGSQVLFNIENSFRTRSAIFLIKFYHSIRY